MIQRDSLVMAFNDNFFVLALTCAAVLPLVLLLRPLPKNFEMAMH
jgi:DHA2 family multidrug resistance protein